MIITARTYTRLLAAAVSTLLLTTARSQITSTQPADLPPAPSSVYSSSAPPSNESPVPEPAEERATRPHPVPQGTYKFGPLSVFGLSAKIGTNGVGLDLTSALGPRFAIRTGASFISTNVGLTYEGIQLNANLKLQNAFAGVDFYPFHNSFRITPGFSFANRTAVAAGLFIPGGQSFSFGDAGNSISDPSDPVHGTADFGFGRSIAPRLTVGWANVIPHHSKTITFPVELGVQTVSHPTASLKILGSACSVQVGAVLSGCGPVDQTSVAQEQTELQQDLKSIPVLPIFTVGVTYWFGRNRNPR